MLTAQIELPNKDLPNDNYDFTPQKMMPLSEIAPPTELTPTISPLSICDQLSGICKTEDV